MEIKDLILLISIPILLVGIISYTNGKTITGAVTAAQEENNALGKYSIMPSFKAKIDYNLEGEYSSIKEKFRKEVIDNCMGSTDIGKCISLKSAEAGMSCPDDGEISILHNFIDRLNDCNNYEKETAVCKYSLNDMPYINTQKSIRNFRIRLTSHYPTTKAELIEDGAAKEYSNMDNFENIFSTDFNNKDGDGRKLNKIEIEVAYRDGKPAITKSTGYTEDSEIDLSNGLIYKSKAGIKFIEKIFENSFKPESPLNNFIHLPKTKGMKFCAKTGAQTLAYDSSDGLVKQRDIIYKFAVTFPVPVPKPIQKLDFRYLRGAEDSVILIWDKPDDNSINSYTIYYSENDFVDEKMDDIKKDTSIKKVSIKSSDYKEIEDIDIDKCVNPDAPCRYSIYGQQLEKSQLYHWKAKNKLIYAINDNAQTIQDNVYLHYAVVAVNDEGEISNDKNAKNNMMLEWDKNYAGFTTIDFLAPAKVENFQAKSTEKGKVLLTWKLPSRNLDGSFNKDVQGIDVYYQKITANQLPERLDIGPGAYTKISHPVLTEDCPHRLCSYELNKLESGVNYKFAITVFDPDGNMYTEPGGYATTQAIVS